MPSWVHESFSGESWKSCGRMRIRRTASLPMSAKVRSCPLANSGRTCATAPTSRSDGLIGRSPGSVTKRVPLRHDVCESSILGSGPKSRSNKTGERPTRPSAKPNERLISGRRPRPAVPARSLTVSTKSARSSSLERISWRCAITSLSGINARAH